jgi:hypothetical protein
MKDTRISNSTRCSFITEDHLVLHWESHSLFTACFSIAPVLYLASSYKAVAPPSAVTSDKTCKAFGLEQRKKKMIKAAAIIRRYIQLTPVMITQLRALTDDQSSSHY